jgi:hypothetical protein
MVVLRVRGVVYRGSSVGSSDGAERTKGVDALPLRT